VCSSDLAIIHAFWEYGSEFADLVEEDEELLNDPTFIALIQLNARGSRVASEIWTLLRSGLSDGATARWRTLHEISVTASFLAEHPAEVADRYLNHKRLHEIRLIQSYHRHNAVEESDRLSEDALQELADEEAQLLKEYGEPFGTSYGWAATALQRKKPTFADIEAHVDLDSTRPTYQAASSQVHSGADGLRPTGLWSEFISRKTLILAGASNAGLADPGRRTALTLAFLATSAMRFRPSVDRLLGASTIYEMARRCDDSFIAGEEKLDQAEAALPDEQILSD